MDDRSAVEILREEMMKRLGIDPDPAKRNPDGSDYHLMNAIDTTLAAMRSAAWYPRMKLYRCLRSAGYTKWRAVRLTLTMWKIRMHAGLSRSR